MMSHGAAASAHSHVRRRVGCLGPMAVGRISISLYAGQRLGLAAAPWRVGSATATIVDIERRRWCLRGHPQGAATAGVVFGPPGRRRHKLAAAAALVATARR